MLRVIPIAKPSVFIALAHFGQTNRAFDIRCRSIILMARLTHLEK